MSDGERVLRELREWCQGTVDMCEDLVKRHDLEEPSWAKSVGHAYKQLVGEIDRRLAALAEGGEDTG